MKRARNACGKEKAKEDIYERKGKSAREKITENNERNLLKITRKVKEEHEI